jgi:hypothetical protein
MTQTIINLGTGGAALNGRNGSTAGADSNDALFLDWPGDNQGNYVYLPGVNGNFLSVPDAAALDVTGDIDLRVRVAMDDWTPAGISGLVSKWLTTGNQRSYSFRLLTTGVLRLVWSADGTAEMSKDSTVAVTVSDGAVKWVRVTLDVDNGASGNDVKFFTSDDGTTWTQLGSTVTTASTTSVHSSSADLSVGQVQASTNMAAAKVYRAQVLNGIGGTTVLDVDTSVITSGSATSFTAVTGQTVTINRSTSGSKTVAVVSPVWLFGTDDFMEVPLTDLLEVDASQDFSIIAIVRTWDTPASSQAIISKRRSTSTSAASPGYWVRNFGTAQDKNLFLDDGSQVRSISATGGTAGVMETVAWSVSRSPVQRLAYLNGVQVNSATAAIAGSFVDKTANFTIGRRANANTVFADMELVGVAFFRRVLSASEMKLIGDYYQARLS